MLSEIKSLEKCHFPSTSNLLIQKEEEKRNVRPEIFLLQVDYCRHREQLKASETKKGMSISLSTHKNN